jgi:hypothetical protein
VSIELYKRRAKKCARHVGLDAPPEGARQFIAASVIDRLVFVPAVLIPLAIAAVFPRLFLTFTIIDHCWQSARGCCLLASESPPWVR